MRFLDVGVTGGRDIFFLCVLLKKFEDVILVLKMQGID